MMKQSNRRTKKSPKMKRTNHLKTENNTQIIKQNTSIRESSSIMTKKDRKLRSKSRTRIKNKGKKKSPSATTKPSSKPKNGSKKGTQKKKVLKKTEKKEKKNVEINLKKQEISKIEFLIPEYYKLIQIIGKGAYGVVARAQDIRDGRMVAIKKIVDIFKYDKEYQKRIYREILVMIHFKHHENIVGLLDISPLPPSEYAEFNDIYLITELMDTDLSAVLKTPQPLTEENVTYFLYQILRGLKYIHSANILHRDMKPSNILLNQQMDVKICDFGLSRGIDQEIDPNLSTNYVATRWYRAPELLLMWEHASKALDIWSVGCIFAEMLSQPNPKRQAIFPGNHHTDQLERILKILGTPENDEIRGCEKAVNYMKKLPIYNATKLKLLYPHASEYALDLLQKMLVFDPLKRITVDEALKHPLLNGLHDPSDEPISSSFEFRYANLKDDICIRTLIQQAIDAYQQEKFGMQPTVNLS